MVCTKVQLFLFWNRFILVVVVYVVVVTGVRGDNFMGGVDRGVAGGMRGINCWVGLGGFGSGCARLGGGRIRGGRRSGGRS